jgi:hypothetical protein
MPSKILPRAVAVFGAALLGATLALAQTPTPAPANTPPPPAAVNHEFDFWVGDWNVTTPDGKAAGTNRIEKISGGHGLLENWIGDPATGGGDGKSLNCYNPGRKQWQQFWIGSGGGVLELAGGLVEGKMVLTGAHVVRGETVTERISWTPNPDGSVRQFWDQSRDDGKTWKPVFDGLYRKK